MATNQSKKQVQREFDSYSDNVGAPVDDASAKSGQHSLSHIFRSGASVWTPDDGTVQIGDGAGNTVSVTGGKLDVNAAVTIPPLEVAMSSISLYPSASWIGLVSAASVQGKVTIVDATGADMDLFKQGDNFAVGADHGIALLGLSDGTPQKYAFFRTEGTDADAETPLTVGAMSTEAYTMMYDQAVDKWNRVRGNTTDGLLVNLGAKNSVLASLPSTQVIGSLNSLASIYGIVTAIGDIAQGAVDSGNPVKIGGPFNATPATLSDTQRGSIQLDNKQNMKVTLMSNNNTYSIANLADNAEGVTVSANTRNLGVMSRNTVFNGTSWDRMPGDTTGVTVKGGVYASLPSTTVLGSLNSLASIYGKVTLMAGTSFIGLATTVSDGYSYVFTSLASITVVKNAKGMLHSILIGAISTPSLNVYDQTSAADPLLITIPVNAPVGTNYVFDANFNTGLTLKFAAGVRPQVTVMYR